MQNLCLPLFSFNNFSKQNVNIFSKLCKLICYSEGHGLNFYKTKLIDDEYEKQDGAELCKAQI